MTNFRLFHLVMFAAFCLLLLKTTALMFSDASLFTGAGQLNAQEAADADAGKAKTGENAGVELADSQKLKGALSEDDAGERAKKARDETAADAATLLDAEAGEVAGPPVDVAMNNAGAKKSERAADDMRPSNYQEYKVTPSGSELDLLESLALRRKQLNDREAQLKMKENLLFAAQRQIDERIEKLKELEAKIQVDLKKQDVLRKNQYQRLVKMYSSMKPKDAARIFDGLEMGILVDLLRAMKASAGSQIVAKMNAEKARAVTLMLAKKEQMVAAEKDDGADELPKIAGDKPAAENQ